MYELFNVYLYMFTKYECNLTKLTRISWPCGNSASEILMICMGKLGNEYMEQTCRLGRLEIQEFME